MKRYLICSDIHGRESYLESALAKNVPLDGVYIAGDLEMSPSELEDMIRRLTSPKTDVRMVCGNCDSYYTEASSLRTAIVFPIQPNHKVFMTHGHRYMARHDIMSYAAQDNGCDIVIYGHIHRKIDMTEYGIRFLNPGAMKDNSYMILTVDDDGNLNVEFPG